MATRLVSTVEQAGEALAKSGLPGNRPVAVIVFDSEEEANLADLKAAIHEADSGNDFIDADQAFEALRVDLRKKYPL
ncbi:MAG: hypothetical protein HQL45_01665 [Alphaproteobacteria bacterium]|nr:hypothetical protein [Alphaproteobacteria bacterium]